MCERPAFGGMTHPRCKTPYAIDGLTSFFRYDGAVQKAVKALKYRFVSDLASEFVDLIPQYFFSDLRKLLGTKPRSVLVPIPLHSARLRHRGFNQAELLGKLIAEKLEIPLCTDILYRIRNTSPQVEMKERDERLKNMARVFSCNNVAMKQYSNIFLFDDVFTTGATMRAAANALRRRGALLVWGITMAR